MTPLAYFFEISPQRDIIPRPRLVWRQFEGGVCVCARTQLPKCACAYINCCRPLPRGEISRAVFIGPCWQIDATTFRGRQDFEVRRDFEETQYLQFSFLYFRGADSLSKAPSCSCFFSVVQFSRVKKLFCEIDMHAPIITICMKKKS